MFRSPMCPDLPCYRADEEKADGEVADGFEDGAGSVASFVTRSRSDELAWWYLGESC